VAEANQTHAMMILQHELYAKCENLIMMMMMVLRTEAEQKLA